MARFGTVLVLVIFAASYQMTRAYRPITGKPSRSKTGDVASDTYSDPSVHSTFLDYDGKYLLRWQYDNETITFNVTVEAKAWVGLGFSPNGGMFGADIVMDRHAYRNQYPIEDAQQDYVLLSASRNDTHITASFRRRRDTCDDKEDYRLTKDNTRLIYAFSNEPISSETATHENLKKHAPEDRGTKGLYLFEPPVVRSHFPADTITLDFPADNVRVPYDYHLTYWCQVFELPKLPVHHLIRFEPVVRKGNEKVLHHLAMYQCSGNMSDYLFKGERCFSGDGGNFTKMYSKCLSKILWFWNLGMAPIDFPPDVGFPMFESSEDSFVLLEVHYENLELRKDFVDNSAIRMYLTPTPRPVEAGLLLVAGVEEEPIMQILPPGESEFPFYVHSDTCFQYLPPGGVNLFYVLLHSHLHARKVRVHHYRDGVQLPDYGTDDNFDMFYQNYRRLDPPRHIARGDEVVMECLYDTSKENKTVFGGFSAFDEMCTSTHYYYPRVAKGFACFSYPDPQAYVPIFGGKLAADNKTVILPSSKNISLHEFVKYHLDWTKPGVREEYRNLVANGQYVQQLHLHPINESTKTVTNAGGQFASDRHVHTMTHNRYPKVTQPWVPKKENRICHPDGRAEHGNQPLDKTRLMAPLGNVTQPAQSAGTVSGVGCICLFIALLTLSYRSFGCCLYYFDFKYL